MTKPCPETIEREKDKLFVTDAELIRRLGIPVKMGKAMLHVLDRELKHGFPQKQKVWGNRRYWPAVKAFLDHHYGYLGMTASARHQSSARMTAPRSASQLQGWDDL